MTAGNIFARGNGVFMFFDAATFDSFGVIKCLNSKLTISERLAIVIGPSGNFASTHQEEISKYLESCSSQREALKGLPNLVKSLACAARALPPPRQPWWHRLRHGKLPSTKPGLRLIIGWWDEATDFGDAAVISDEIDAEENGIKPFALFPVRNFVAPCPEEGRYFDYEFDFDPLTDGPRLAEFQRHEPNENGSYRVGGWFEAVRIHRDGIDHSIVHRWPDRVGSKIKVAA